MNTEATQPTFDPPASTAIPRWVLFEHYGNDDKDSTADDGTMATAHTSSGDPIGVSLRLAPPPAVSSICVLFPLGLEDNHSSVLAAHGNSILIYVHLKKGYNDETGDYFVYNAGAASAEPPRPPSLWLLPPPYVTKEDMEKYHSRRARGPVRRHLDRQCTGLLRRGDDEFAVAELKMEVVSYDTPVKYEAKLFLLRSGQWSVNRPMAIRCNCRVGKLLSSWRTNSVLPVGDEHLCWVDLSHGLLFLNVFGSGDGESPVLQHVPLPVEAEELEPVSGPGSSRRMSVTAGGSTVRLVGVFPRCCCGGTGATHCQRSLHAYMIRTWSLRMDDMVWEMDGMVDATELWALNAYEGLPRVPPVKPIVSLDDPHTIFFIVSEWCHVRGNGGDQTGWLILVDIRRKALSTSRHIDARWLCTYMDLLPSGLSCYLKGSNPSGSDGASPSSSEGHVDMIPSSPVVVVNDEMQRNDQSNSMRCSCKSSSEVILAAFQEIPRYGLNCADMLKAYSILSQDSGRRCRSLLGLPKNLRKDWLLMEIKTTEA